jgi:hypothetical protein
MTTAAKTLALPSWAPWTSDQSGPPAYLVPPRLHKWRTLWSQCCFPSMHLALV